MLIIKEAVFNHSINPLQHSSHNNLNKNINCMIDTQELTLMVMKIIVITRIIFIIVDPLLPNILKAQWAFLLFLNNINNTLDLCQETQVKINISIYIK